MISSSIFQHAQRNFSDPRCRGRLFAAILILFVVSAYLPAMTSGFIWDDDILLTANPNVHNIHGLTRIWLGKASCDYSPLTFTSYWLEEKLWGDAAADYHIVNILLHAVSAVLLWRIFEKLRVPGAWLGALLFAIHPVNVASVAWIAELKNALACVFFFGAWLSYLKFYELWKKRFYAFSILLFLLAALSKGAVVMMPVVLLGCVLWSNRKITARDALRIVPFMVIATVMALLTIRYQATAANFEILPANISFRIARAGAAVWIYLREIVFPIGLSPMSPQWWPDLNSPSAYLPAILVVAFAILFFAYRRTWARPLCFISGYYLVLLLPVLGFFWMTLQQEIHCADWWQYFAAPGIFAGIAAGIVTLVRSTTQKARFALHILLCGLVVALTVQTWRRASVYHSMETYCRAVLAEDPDLWSLQTNLGVALEQEGKLDEAIAHHREALRANPRFMEAHNNLANVFVAKGAFDQGEVEYLRALRLAPSNADVLSNLADLYFREGKLQNALARDAEAIQADRYNPERYLKFGAKLMANKQFEQAAICFRNAQLLARGD